MGLLYAVAAGMVITAILASKNKLAYADADAQADKSVESVSPNQVEGTQDPAVQP